MKFDAVGSPDQLQLGGLRPRTGVGQAQGLIEAEIGQRQRQVLGLGCLQGQLHKARRRKHHLGPDAVITQISRGRRRQGRGEASFAAAGQFQGLQAGPEGLGCS